MVVLGESNYGVLASLEPGYLRSVNEESYARWDDADTAIDIQQLNAEKPGQYLTWRLKSLLRRV